MGPDSLRRIFDTFAERGGILRTRDALAAGIHPRELYQLRDEGFLEELERGLFVAADRELIWHPGPVAATLKQPAATLCLISALDHWGLGTQIAHYVYVALPRGVRAPRLSSPVRAFHWSGEALTAGVVEETLDGVPVRIYGPAKTVVDCFRARNKVGIHVAVEALRYAIDYHACTVGELAEYAARCGVSSVMAPYLELVQEPAVLRAAPTRPAADSNAPGAPSRV